MKNAKTNKKYFHSNFYFGYVYPENFKYTLFMRILLDVKYRKMWTSYVKYTPLSEEDSIKKFVGIVIKRMATIDENN